MAKGKTQPPPPDDDDFYFGDGAFAVKGQAAPAGPLPVTAADLCWNLTCGPRKDLLELLDAAFPATARDAAAWDEAHRVLKAVLSERFGHRVVALVSFLIYAKQHQYPPLAWQAACWNETLHRLGHPVPARDRRDPGLPEKP